VIIVLSLLGIILLGLVVGLARRPKVQNAHRAYAQALRAMAGRTGWQIGRPPFAFPRLRDLNNAIGAGTRADTTVTAQLSGQWQGVPVRVLQLYYWKDQVAVRSRLAATMIVLPRPVPGPNVTLTARGISWTNFMSGNRSIGHPAFDTRYHVHAGSVEEARAVLTPAVAGQLASDPRTQDRIFLFGEEVAAVFPGLLTQEAVTVATTDLLVDLVRRMAG